MTMRRAGSLFMAVLSLLFVMSGIPVQASSDASGQTEAPLPLSLTCPASDSLYFLPPYDEVANLSPSRRLYAMPAISSADIASDMTVFSVVCVKSETATDLYTLRSISPRAP